MLRLGGAQFDALLQLIDGMIKKQDTKMRMAIPTASKLEITLRYLATGDSFKSLEYLFRVPEPTFSLFVPEVFTAISHVLKPFIKMSENGATAEFVLQDGCQRNIHPNQPYFRDFSPRKCGWLG